MRNTQYPELSGVPSVDTEYATAVLTQVTWLEGAAKERHFPLKIHLHAYALWSVHLPCPTNDSPMGYLRHDIPRMHCAAETTPGP